MAVDLGGPHADLERQRQPLADVGAGARAADAHPELLGAGRGRRDADIDRDGVGPQRAAVDDDGNGGDGQRAGAARGDLEGIALDAAGGSALRAQLGVLLGERAGRDDGGIGQRRGRGRLAALVVGDYDRDLERVIDVDRGVRYAQLDLRRQGGGRQRGAGEQGERRGASVAGVHTTHPHSHHCATAGPNRNRGGRFAARPGAAV